MDSAPGESAGSPRHLAHGKCDLNRGEHGLHAGARAHFLCVCVLRVFVYVLRADGTRHADGARV
eukprot:5810681-Prymnesium_polylepis.1